MELRLTKASLKNYQKSDMEFSFKNILKREYHGFFAIIISFNIFKIMGQLIVSPEDFTYIPNLRWKFLLLFGCSIWLICRILKKTTNILNVKGR